MYNNSMIKSAYIHIPFCNRKCNYCTFVSYDTLTLKNIYIDSLINEIKDNYNGEILDTIYFGGGTPSILSINDFRLILNELKFKPQSEITVEINPETVDRAYLEELKTLGVNRLSIGIQAFDNEILKLIGRNHTKETAALVVKFAKDVGFDNISIDLIYGLPKQDLSKLKESLEQILNIDVKHVSLYGLKIEEGCSFYNNKPEFLPENDDQAEMYIESINFLKDNGFEHYEISNFAKPGYESKHNLNYWNNGYYYGFGVAASGYEDDIRYTNLCDIEKYLQNHDKKESIAEINYISQLEEEIFLGLRKTEGINTKIINEKFDIDFDNKYSKIIEKHTKTELLKRTPSGYALTTEGILLSNNVLSDFIEA